MKHYHIVITDDNDTNPVLLEQSQSLRLLLNHLNTAGSGVDKLIGSMLLTLGIPASLNGYPYLCEAVRLVMESSDFMKPITRKLYPAIAAEFGTSPGRAERCIRHAIKVAWQRGKVERLNALLGFHIVSQEDQPSNSELIALLAESLQQERDLFMDLTCSQAKRHDVKGY